MSVNTTNDLESFLGSLVGGVPATAVLITLLSIALAIVVWMRTRSTHMLMSRLWVLFNGKSDCKDDQVKKLLDSQSALMQFRFLTGIHVRTLQHISRLNLWANTNNEDIGDIAACGQYFDLDEPKLKEDDKLPSFFSQVFLGIFVVALSVTLICFLGGAITDRALLQLRSSGTFFTLNNEYAKPFSSSSGFKLNKCSDDHKMISSSSGFSVPEVDVICKVFLNNEVNEYVNSTVRFQRLFFSISSPFLAYFSLVLFSFLLQGVAAHNMKKRLKRFKKDGAIPKHS